MTPTAKLPDRRAVTAPDDGADAVQFFRHLAASRLLPPSEVEELARRARGEPLAHLQAELLRRDRLTDYQLARLVEGRGEELTLGKYRILRALGNGGFGCVYLAYHTLMHRRVAVKMLGEESRGDPTTRALFRREVVAATRLTHPHIVAALDADEAGGEVFFVMEYVEGPTLEAQVQRHGPIPVPLAVTVLAHVADALRYAAGQGFVHRDIKPANLILAGVPADTPHPPGDTVCTKLLDFGLARVPLHPLPHSVMGTLPCDNGQTFGTPAYMSPEQILNPHAVDVRSDLYSLGCTMFFALTGQLPFPAHHLVETYRRHLEEPPVSVALLNPSVPPRLADVVRVLMAKDPANRFQSPDELLCVLAPPLTPPPVIPTPPVAAQPVPIDPEPEPEPEPELGPDVTAEAAGCWAKWLAVVSAGAKGDRPEMPEAEYRLLYSRLLAAARAAERCPVSGDCWRRMAVAVEPWVSLRAVYELDRRMLASLRTTCGALDAELNPPRAGSSRPGVWVSLAAVVLAGVAVGAWWLLR